MPGDYARQYGEMLLTKDLTTMPEDRTWRLNAPPREGEHHDIVLYLGCNVLRTSHMIRTVTAIFDRLGLDYIAVGGPTYCCGIVQHRGGDAQASEDRNLRTIELFERYSPKEIVMWCPSCIYFYDEVKQRKMPVPSRHAAEFLASKLPELTFTHRVEARVALHAHAQNEARRREAAAGCALLRAVPGLSLVDIESEPRFGRLCTAQVQAELGQDTWNALVLDEIDRARDGGAEILATIYHGCQRLLCGFESQRPIGIEHYLSVFARGLGIEFEDRYKTFRLWEDPERVLAESTPCQQANGMDPARARELVTAIFPARPE
jgi:Fe-S oxidoreductase